MAWKRRTSVPTTEDLQAVGPGTWDLCRLWALRSKVLQLLRMPDGMLLQVDCCLFCFHQYEHGTGRLIVDCWLLIVVLLLCFLPSKVCRSPPVSSLSFIHSLFTHTGSLLLFTVDCWFSPVVLVVAAAISCSTGKWATKIGNFFLTSPPVSWNYNFPTPLMGG